MTWLWVALAVWFLVDLSLLTAIARDALKFALSVNESGDR